MAAPDLCCYTRAFSRLWQAGVTLQLRLLMVMPSLAAECGLSEHGLSLVVAHGLSCPAACGLFQDQGSDPRSPHWRADS